jgi:hypothetical protein
MTLCLVVVVDFRLFSVTNDRGSLFNLFYALARLLTVHFDIKRAARALVMKEGKIMTQRAGDRGGKLLSLSGKQFENVDFLMEC